MFRGMAVKVCFQVGVDVLAIPAVLVGMMPEVFGLVVVDGFA